MMNKINDKALETVTGGAKRTVDRGELRNSLNNPKADAFIEKMTEQGYYLKETSKDLKGRLRYISYTGDNTLLQKIIKYKSAL